MVPNNAIIYFIDLLELKSKFKPFKFGFKRSKYFTKKAPSSSIQFVDRASRTHLFEI